MNEEMMALIESIAKTGAEGLLGLGGMSPNVFQDMATLAKLPKQIKDRASGKKTYREFLLEENTGNGKTFAESIGLMPSRMSLEELMQEFMEQYKELGIYDMPESGRKSEAFLKRMSDRDLQRYYDDEEREMAMKASIMLDMFKRGGYDYKLGGTNVPLLREDYLKTDVRKVFGDKSK